MDLKQEITAALGIEPTLLIAHIVAATIIFFLLYFFVWKKVVSFLDKREQNIREEIESAAKLNSQANKKVVLLEKKLANASQKAHQIINKAQSDAKEQRKNIIEKANKDAKHLIESTKVMIAADRNDQRQRMQEEAIKGSFKICQAILKREVTAKDHDDLIKHFITDIADSNEE